MLGVVSQLPYNEMSLLTEVRSLPTADSCQSAGGERWARPANSPQAWLSDSHRAPIWVSDRQHTCPTYWQSSVLLRGPRANIRRYRWSCAGYGKSGTNSQRSRVQTDRIRGPFRVAFCHTGSVYSSSMVPDLNSFFIAVFIAHTLKIPNNLRIQALKSPPTTKCAKPHLLNADLYQF